MKRALATLLGLSMVACGDPAPAPEPQPEPPAAPAMRRALWILAEGSHRTLEDPAKVEQLIEDAVALGMTDLFVQIYRAGRSWYPSSHADQTPALGLAALPGGSPLPRLIEHAHGRGLRVHAWFNALSLAGNRDAPILRAVGPDAVLVDRLGRSLLDYPALEVPAPDGLHTRMGTPGVWLDPSTPGVIEFLEAAVDDLVRALPELDGLHLDFIRHPIALPIVPGSRFDVGLDFGYGQPAVAGFEAETGRSFRRGDAWDGFRRERVSEVVRRLKARLPQDWEQSAAVLPWADRAYLSAMQDWRHWLERGWLDFAVAMAYSRDDVLLRYVAEGLRGGVAGERVWLGLGTWLFIRDPARARAQLQIAQAARPAGVALFSYDALAGRRETLETLAWSP